MAIVIYDSKGQPFAKPYYDTFKTEPYEHGKSLTVKNVEPVNRWNFPKLLSTIISQGKTDKDLIIVGHGIAQGLSIPLAAGKKLTAAQFKQLNILSSNQSIKEKALKCMISKAEVKAILKLRAQVMNLKLRRIEFRACNMGKISMVLQAYKTFLGANTVGAPDLFDCFGPFNFNTPTKDPQTWKKMMKLFPKPREFSMPGGKVAIHHKRIGATLDLKCLAETKKAVQDWVKAYLPATQAQINTQSIPFHALLGGRLIYPNENDFVRHIKHYSKGNPLLQGDIFDETGFLQNPEAEEEQRICARTRRRTTGTIGMNSKISHRNRGPIGIG
ncbi:MAG: hypothetical protein ACYSW7_01485 [Planctomycetota bacterium]|jgi:hypothetical protein